MVTDLALIPIQASQFDLWTLDRMDNLVESAKGFNEKLRTLVMLSRAPTNPAVSDPKDAADLISDFANIALAKSVICDRVSYRRSASAGMGVIEHQPVDQKATAEIEALYQEMYS